MQEARLRVVLETPVQHAGLGPRQIETFLSPCDPDVGEATFFFHLFRIVQGTAVWEQPFFHPNQEDDWELEPFGRVERHERDLVQLVDFFERVEVRDERQVGQESDERLFIALFLEVLRDREELLQVLEAALGFKRLLDFEHLFVA